MKNQNDLMMDNNQESLNGIPKLIYEVLSASADVPEELIIESLLLSEEWTEDHEFDLGILKKEINDGNWKDFYESKSFQMKVQLLYDWLEDNVVYVISPERAMQLSATEDLVEALKMETKDIEKIQALMKKVLLKIEFNTIVFVAEFFSKLFISEASGKQVIKCIEFFVSLMLGVGIKNTNEHLKNGKVLVQTILALAKENKKEMSGSKSLRNSVYTLISSGMASDMYFNSLISDEVKKLLDEFTKERKISVEDAVIDDRFSSFYESFLEYVNFKNSSLKSQDNLYAPNSIYSHFSFNGDDVSPIGVSERNQMFKAESSLSENSHKPRMKLPAKRLASLFGNVSEKENPSLVRRVIERINSDHLEGKKIMRNILSMKYKEKTDLDVNYEGVIGSEKKQKIFIIESSLEDKLNNNVKRHQYRKRSIQNKSSQFLGKYRDSIE